MKLLWEYYCDALARSAYCLVYVKKGAYILELNFVMSSVHLSSCICGFHEYQAFWEPTHGEKLDCSREISNTSDPYAVSLNT